MQIIIVLDGENKKAKRTGFAEEIAVQIVKL